MKPLKEILQRDLDATPLKTENPDTYHQKIFETFPGLKVLDNLDKDGKEFQYEESEEDLESGEDEEGKSENDEEFEEDDGFPEEEEAEGEEEEEDDDGKELSEQD